MAHCDKKFVLPEFLTVGITDKVYLANENVMQIYLASIEVDCLSENLLPPFATYLNLNTAKALLRPSALFNHSTKKWTDCILKKGWRKHRSNAAKTCICFWRRYRF